MEKLHLISADTLYYKPLDHPRMPTACTKSAYHSFFFR